MTTFATMEKATQYELRLAERMSRLGTETAFEVLNKARALERQGKDIIHLEIGEPDFDTPKDIVEAGIEALKAGWTHYGPSAGLPELRQAIADDVERSRGVKVTSDWVVVVPGGKPIIFFTMLALADVGDEVIYPNPGFPIYESMIHYVGAKAVPIRLRKKKISASMWKNWPTDHRSHQAHHPEFTPQSHRRHAQQARHQGHHRSHRRSKHHGAVRRNLQPPDVRWRPPPLNHVGTRLQRAHHSPGRLLQDLRDDRMENGVRGHAAGPRGPHGAAYRLIRLRARRALRRLRGLRPFAGIRRRWIGCGRSFRSGATCLWRD